MIKPSSDEIYPVFKLSTIVDALTAEGVLDALAGVSVCKSALSSPAARVSINQISAERYAAATIDVAFAALDEVEQASLEAWLARQDANLELAK